MARQRVQCFYPLSNRGKSLSQDASLINGIVEKGNGQAEVWVRKRPGYVLNYTVTSGSAGGLFDTPWGLISIWGNTAYLASSSLGSVSSNTAGVMGHITTSGKDGNNLLLVSSNAGYNVTTTSPGNVTSMLQITDSNFTSAAGQGFIRGCAYLDATYYVATPLAIYGSNLNDPTTWPSLNILLNQSDGDPFVCMATQLVYVVLFKSFTIDVYYDAANPVGNPLGLVGGARQTIGCLNAATVQDCSGILVWVGNTRSGPAGIFSMEGLKTQKISTPEVDRLLLGNLTGTIYSWQFTVNGHLYYCLTATATNFTVVYDFYTKLWYIWQSTSGSYLPIAYSASDSLGNVYLQDTSNGNIYTTSPFSFSDNGVAFKLTLTTDNIDLGTRALKNNGYIDIVTDETSNSTLNIQYSIDDYQTWSTPQAVDLSQDRPFISDIGEWRKIALQLSHSTAIDFRLQAFEITADAGNF